jgi:hypothetical protein
VYQALKLREIVMSVREEAAFRASKEADRLVGESIQG